MFRSELPVVVVLAYGRTELLHRSLGPLVPGFPALVVDNGRQDDTRQVCHELGVRYVRPDRNLGFSGGVNRALREIGGRHDVLLLNSDAVLEPDGLAALHARLRADPAERLCAVAPVLRRPDGTPERTLWPVPGPLRAWAGAFGAGDLGLRERVFVNGAVLLLAAEALAEVGPFDERYFLYCEEADWQLQAHHRGWRVAVVPEVEALHVGAASSSSGDLRETLFHGAAELFVRKWYGAVGWQLFRAGSVAAATRRLVTARDRDSMVAQGRLVRRLLGRPARRLPRAIEALG